MTAAFLLTLDADAAVAERSLARGARVAPGQVVERFCTLLDAHAISGTWFVHQDTSGGVLAAIRAMRARQDLVSKPRLLPKLRPGVAFAMRTHALGDLERHMEAVLARIAGKRGGSGEWMPKALRLVAFRANLERAIRGSAVFHVHIRLSELARRPNLIRLLEDLLFRVAEERRSRRLRIVTVSDARRALVSERVTQAA
jgi:hypothetical protein